MPYTERAHSYRCSPYGVIRLLDGRISSDPYLATELISGTALDQVIMDTIGPELEHTARIGREVARTAAFLHQNDTLYLELKPDNILMRQDDTPVFIDFNTAASRSEDSTVLHADPLKPPEQTPPGNPEQIAAHTDVYALGAVLYALYTGSVPATEEYRSEGLDPVGHQEGHVHTGSERSSAVRPQATLQIDTMTPASCISICFQHRTIQHESVGLKTPSQIQNSRSSPVIRLGEQQVGGHPPRSAYHPKLPISPRYSADLNTSRITGNCTTGARTAHMSVNKENGSIS